jgi:hypothetical protein
MIIPGAQNILRHVPFPFLDDGAMLNMEASGFATAYRD